MTMNKNRAVVEMPQGTMLKYEMDNTTGVFFLDRKLPIHTPFNYGFIKDTLAPDGDALDCFITGPYLDRGTETNYETIGYFECDDNGESDDKMVVRVKGSDEGIHWKRLILDYLTHYKLGFKVGKWVDGPHPLESTQIEVVHKWHPISRF